LATWHWLLGIYLKFFEVGYLALATWHLLGQVNNQINRKIFHIQFCFAYYCN